MFALVLLACLASDTAFAASLYFVPDRPGEEFEAVRRDARSIAESIESSFEVVNADAVMVDRELAMQIEAELASGSNTLTESMSLKFFTYSCRWRELSETRVGAEHIGGWWGHGSCENAKTDLYVGSNLERDYFQLVLYVDGRRQFVLKLIEGTDFAVLYQIDPYSWPPPASHSLPSGITLLPGFEHVPRNGIDSLVGIIEKERDLSIYYDIGAMAGNYATGRADERLWLQSYDDGGRHVDIAMRRDRTLVVSFSWTEARGSGLRERGSYANFYGTVWDDEDMARFLMMVLGYNGNEN